MSVKSGYTKEYGAHIVVDKNGNWKMVDVTEGKQDSIPNMPAAPDNAVAEIHTHPGEVYPSGGRSEGNPQPSGADATRVNLFHIYGVVVAPRDYGIIPVDVYGWMQFPRGGGR